MSPGQDSLQLQHVVGAAGRVEHLVRSRRSSPESASLYVLRGDLLRQFVGVVQQRGSAFESA